MLDFIRSLMFNVKSAAAIALPNWMGSPSYGATNYEYNLKGRFRKNELIYACVDKTGKAAAQINMEVRRRSTNELLPNHPLQLLLEKPNSFMSEMDLWECVLVLQMLAGRCLLEKERNNAGKVIGLWPLRPDWVEIVPSKTDLIAGYNFGAPGYPKTFIPKGDILDLPLFHPESPIIPFQTTSPVAQASRVTDTDSQITDFIKLFFEKGGVPPGLLKTKQKLIESQVGILRRRWRERYGGIQNWMEPAILDSDAEYQRIGQTFQEMGFEVLDRRNETRICQVLDIPPIIVGAFVGIEKSTFDNYGNARKAWWQDSLMPRFIRIRDRIRLQLVPEFGSDITAVWDTTNVFAFQEDEEMRWRKANAALAVGGITINMYLQEIGKNPIGKTGEVFLRPLSSVEVPLKGERPVQEEQDKLLLVEGEIRADRPDDADIRTELEIELQSAVQDAFTETLQNIIKEMSDVSG